MKSFPRTTLRSDVHLSGVGLHTGAPVKVKVVAGDSGIRFCRAGAWVEAKPENVTDTQRCTRLGEVAMVEHLLSALAGLEITDADVEVEGDELPGFDGSALPYVGHLKEGGREPCGTLEVEGPFARVFSVEGGSQVSIAAGDGMWRYEFDLEARLLGVQAAEFLLEPWVYEREVSPARTTVFEDELEAARQLGLGKGLTAEAVVAIRDGGYAAPLRMPDEPARHKLLDLIGDLSLAGVPVRCLRTVAQRSGHRANVAAAARLASHVVVRRVRN